MTQLSVNLNKIALLRNARNEGQPDVVTAAKTCMDTGCGGITVHPRPDQRHMRPADVHALAATTRGRAELNVEGNPFAPEQGTYPGFLPLAAAVRPDQVTLVPDADGQLTSDHGFNLARDLGGLQNIVGELTAQGARVSLFVDAGADDSAAFRSAAEIGVARVEIYTGPYAQAWARGDPDAAIEACVTTAQRASAAGLQVNAGHDLTLDNLGSLQHALPYLAEVSIGHALIAEALYQGLEPTVKRYLQLLG